MKKRILIIIAIIMTISTIVKTLIVGYSFFSFSTKMINNESQLIFDILKESTHKEKLLHLIKNSKPIKDIEFINTYKKGIEFSFKKETITAFYPVNSKKSLEIEYNGKIYFERFNQTIIHLLLFAFISLILIILIVNYFLTPYLEILESVKNSTSHILKGDFDYKLHTNLKGEAQNFVNSFNDFLEKLRDSFGVIEDKYTALIEKKPSSNPLTDAKETISQLAEIFKFKRVIEEDLDASIILNRIIEIVESFNITQYAVIGIDNKEKKIFFTKVKGEICCNVETNYELCRAYRLKHEINSNDYNHLCEFHICNNKYYCLPLGIGSGNFSGILKIMYTNEDILDKLAYLKAYLKEASTIIESKYTFELLKKQSIKDALTGFYNRRYLEEVLPKILASAKRKNTKVGFLMIDIDYFKKVNDTYGHDAGDAILKGVSTIILNTIRESDIAIRYGGEEFLVILTDLNNKDDLLKAAEKIRKKVESSKFSTNQAVIKKTISIGASLFPDNCDKMWECIKYADLALYKAKQSGRNKVVIYYDELKQEADY